MKNNNIRWNAFIPFPGYIAITLFKRVFARKKYRPLSEHTLRHEFCHIKQQNEYGLKFYWIYFRDWLKYGYRNIPFEVSAREYANNPSDRDYLAWRSKVNNNY